MEALDAIKDMEATLKALKLREKADREEQEKIKHLRIAKTVDFEIIVQDPKASWSDIFDDTEVIVVRMQPTVKPDEYGSLFGEGSGSVAYYISRARRVIIGTGGGGTVYLKLGRYNWSNEPTENDPWYWIKANATRAMDRFLSIPGNFELPTPANV